MTRPMIVDDQEPMRRILKKLLDGQKGVSVVAEARDSDEPLRLLDDMALDLVLMDVQTPGMGGF